MFFNTKGFLTEAAYEWCWNDTITKISQKKADEASAMAICEANRVAALAACLDGSSSSNRFHPYPAVKPKFKGTISSTEGKPFQNFHVLTCHLTTNHFSNTLMSFTNIYLQNALLAACSDHPCRSRYHSNSADTLSPAH